MSLLFYVEPKPHDYLREGMVDQIPAGKMYLQSETMIPRSILPQRFVLETTTHAPVHIFVNNALVKTHIPRSAYDVIELSVQGVANIMVRNDIDAPVFLTVTATHMVMMFDALAATLYDVAGRTAEHYLALFTSPWASFIIDWLLPWQKELPDVRSARHMSLKMAANSMFNGWGQDGGVRDMASVFTSTTPVLHRCQNPQTWQPELYQPYTSGDDQFGWDFHLWLPNLCVNRWHAFLRYVNNQDKYDFVRFNEDVIMLQQRGSQYFQQHIFDNTGKGCSYHDLLMAMGCMDRWTIAGVLSLTSEPSFCMWAHGFDASVELPGIGGSFFDSGSTFDLGATFDSVYDIDLKTDYWLGTSLSHFTDSGSCFDTYSPLALLPQDQDCCWDGPDTKVLSTMRLDASVLSPVKPVHPLYGGDDPGLLADPYFGILS